MNFIYCIKAEAIQYKNTTYWSCLRNQLLKSDLTLSISWRINIHKPWIRALLFTSLGHYSKILVFRDPVRVLVLILHSCNKNKSFSWKDLPIIKFISQKTYKYILMQPDNLYSRQLKEYMVYWMFAINCKQMAMNNYYKVKRTFSLITFTLIIHYFSFYFLLFLRME